MREVLKDRRALLTRLVVAEVLARRGEGPLTPRFRRKRRGRGAAAVRPTKER